MRELISSIKSTMALSKTASTHLIYQFIILTLLFLGISYNEFFPERKFVFLSLIPMFSYQLLILSFCTELIALPDWMDFSNAVITNFRSKGILEEIRESSPKTVFAKEDSTIDNEDNSVVAHRCNTSKLIKTAPNLENIEMQLPRTPTSRNKRAKSWVNLREPAPNVFRQKEEILRKGSMENLTALAKQDEMNKTVNLTTNIKFSSNFRRDTAVRTKSWKMKRVNQDVEEYSQQMGPPPSVQAGTPNEVKSNTNCIESEESELTKSYSFPFRQKRLEKWIELKENKAEDPLKNSSFPYWKTQGYNLAVKYEARRRRRADSGPAATADDEGRTTITYEPSTKQPRYSQADDSMNTNKICAKKNSVKPNLAYLNKVKMGFSQLISKSRKPENRLHNSNKDQLKSEKDFEGDSCLAIEERNGSIPKLPKFLSIERPVFLYPKYLPFEKDRFEKDVKKKMLELGEEQTSC